MAVCDSDKKYIFVDASFPGSAHDSRVFKSSQLYQVLQKEIILRVFCDSLVK